MNRLRSKVAIVTGGSQGIGRACVQRMAEEGAGVAIFDVVDAPGQSLAADLTRTGSNVRYWHVDVSVENQVRQEIAAAVAHFGRLDVLINNAGIGGSNKPTDEITEAEWDRVQAVNVKGAFFAVKHAVPHLRRCGGGSIVHVSSIYGIVGAPDSPPYHASKAALRIMAKTDALLYAHDRIRVNSVHPGFIQTGMVEDFLASQADASAGRGAIEALHPLGHMGEPDDIAWAVVYPASAEAKFITGAEFVIDGGYTAR